MTVLRPQTVSPNINNPFDATNNQDFIFSVDGSSDQVVKSTIAITDIATNTQVYTNTINSFLLKQTIPANVLSNNKTYRWNVITYNSSGVSSIASDSMIFKCIKTPTISIDNIIGGIVNSQSFIVKGSYLQSDGELLQSYQYILQTLNGVNIYSSPTLFDGLLTFKLDNLENATSYKLKLQILTQNNMSVSTVIDFICNFIEPTLSGVLTLENYPSEAAVKSSALIIKNEGNGQNYTFEDNEYVNLTSANSVVYFNVIMSNNFISKLWLKGIVEDKIFCTIYGNNNIDKIELQYYANKIHVFKTNVPSGLVSHFVNIGTIDISPSDNVCIMLKQINGKIDVFVQKI